MMPRPYVTNVFTNPESTQVTVVFNENMILYAGWQETDFSLYITGYQEPYEITWSLKDSKDLKVTGSSQFVFDVEIKDQMLGSEHEKIHVLFLNHEFFRSQATTLKLIDWHVTTSLLTAW